MAGIFGENRVKEAKMLIISLLWRGGRQTKVVAAERETPLTAGLTGGRRPEWLLPNCTKAKINRFLKRMRNFKLLYPRFADLDVYVAIAALNYTKEAEAYA